MDDLFAVMLASGAALAATARALGPHRAASLSELRDAIAFQAPVHVAPLGNHNTYEDELVRLLNVCDALDAASICYGIREIRWDPALGLPDIAAWRGAERTDRARVEAALLLWREIDEERVREDDRRAAATRGDGS